MPDPNDTDAPVSTLYDAFISYSHAKDKPVAAALQSVVQRLGKPWYRRRALRIFRDDTSLAATPELWPTIEQALARSRYIVLLASPQFAASRWCGLEVAYWLEHNSVDTILIAVTEGDLRWDSDAGDFVWDHATPLPQILKGQFRAEPKWIDLRSWRDAPDPREPRFIDAGADFAAAIHGIPKEDLLSQEVRQQRRALSLAWSAAAVLMALAALAGWQWREAVEQRTLAQAQRDRAELALRAAAETSNTLVIDLANEFRDRPGMPVGLLRNILERARNLQRQLIETGETSTALLESASFALDEMVLTLLDLGETETAIDIARQSLAMSRRLTAVDPSNDDWRRGESVSYNKIGYAYMRAGQREQAVTAYGQALEIIRALAAKDPSNLMWQRDVSVTLGRLADALAQAGQRVAALAARRESLDISRKLAEAKPSDLRAQRDLSLAYEQLGDLVLLSNFNEGLAAYRQSLALREKIVAANPDSVEAQRDLTAIQDRLGTAMIDVRDFAKALDYFRQSLAIRERLAAADPDNVSRKLDLVISYHKIGDALSHLARHTEALTYMQKASAISDALAERSPDNLQWRRERALSGRKVAETLAAMGQREEALAVYRNSLSLFEQLTLRDPDNVIWQEDIADVLDRIGNVLSEMRQTKAAVETLRQAFAIRDKLAKEDAQNGRRLRTLNVTANRLGAALSAAGEHAQAVVVLQRSLDVAQKLSALDPENRVWRSDIAFSAEALGEAFLALGQSEDALAAFRRGLAVTEALAGSNGSEQQSATVDPAYAYWQRMASISHERIGRAFTMLKQHAAALAAFERSLAIRSRLADAAPGNANAHRDLYFVNANIGTVERERGELARALAAYGRAIAAIESVLAQTPGSFDDQQRLGTAIGISFAIHTALKQPAKAVPLLKRWLAEVERSRAADADNLYWTKQYAITLATLANAGDDPRARYEAALAIARKLKAEGRLTADESQWIEKLEAAIAALPA